jgi:hypothetical protein
MQISDKHMDLPSLIVLASERVHDNPNIVLLKQPQFNLLVPTSSTRATSSARRQFHPRNIFLHIRPQHLSFESFS